MNHTILYLILTLFLTNLFSQHRSPVLRIEESKEKIALRSTAKRAYIVLQKDGEVSTVYGDEELSEKLKESSVISIQSSKLFIPQIDSMLKATQVLKVHNGEKHNTPYKGKDIIIGIIDGGFDYTHPSFKDKDGETRILRVWDQRKGDGIPPHPYKYGTELTSKQEILAEQHDQKIGSHGTHVATIAAGSVIENLPYHGTAPESDLIFVSTTYMSHAIIDAVDYIFTIAEELGKPTVINMSLASASGPHDGTSLEDRAMDQHSHRGIIVCSASNSGHIRQHVRFDLKPGDTLRTFTTVPWRNLSLDFWGEPEQKFDITLTVVDSLKNPIHVLPAVPLATELFDTTLLVGYDSIQIQMAGDTSSPLNGKPNFSIIYSVKSGEIWASNDIILSITGTEGTVHGWNGMYTNFSSNNRPGFTNGDYSSTIGDGVGTSKSTITVAASTTKKEYFNWLGQQIPIEDTSQLGGIAAFSSRGPTIDGRDKPDITAPGFGVVSAMNSFETGVDSSGVVLFHDFEGRSYPFICANGTSQSSPVVAGAVALMLNAAPNLKRNDIIDIFNKTSIRDQFVQEEFRWGAGKININAIITEIEENYSHIKEKNRPIKSASIQLFPGQLHLKGIEAGIADIKVFTLTGKQLLKKSVEIKSESVTALSIPHFASGVYLYRVKTMQQGTMDGRILID